LLSTEKARMICKFLWTLFMPPTRINQQRTFLLLLESWTEAVIIIGVFFKCSDWMMCRFPRYVYLIEFGIKTYTYISNYTRVGKLDWNMKLICNALYDMMIWSLSCPSSLDDILRSPFWSVSVCYQHECVRLFDISDSALRLIDHE